MVIEVGNPSTSTDPISTDQRVTDKPSLKELQAWVVDKLIVQVLDKPRIPMIDKVSATPEVELRDDGGVGQVNVKGLNGEVTTLQVPSIILQYIKHSVEGSVATGNEGGKISRENSSELIYKLATTLHSMYKANGWLNLQDSDINLTTVAADAQKGDFETRVAMRKQVCEAFTGMLEELAKAESSRLETRIKEVKSSAAAKNTLSAEDASATKKENALDTTSPVAKAAPDMEKLDQVIGGIAQDVSIKALELKATAEKTNTAMANLQGQVNAIQDTPKKTNSELQETQKAQEVTANSEPAPKEAAPKTDTAVSTRRPLSESLVMDKPLDPNVLARNEREIKELTAEMAKLTAESQALRLSSESAVTGPISDRNDPAYAIQETISGAAPFYHGLRTYQAYRSSGVGLVGGGALEMVRRLAQLGGASAKSESLVEQKAKPTEEAAPTIVAQAPAPSPAPSPTPTPVAAAIASLTELASATAPTALMDPRTEKVMNIAKAIREDVITEVFGREIAFMAKRCNLHSQSDKEHFFRGVPANKRELVREAADFLNNGNPDGLRAGPELSASEAAKLKIALEPGGLDVLNGANKILSASGRKKDSLRQQASDEVRQAYKEIAALEKAPHHARANPIFGMVQYGK